MEISFWQDELGLEDWKITTQRITDDQVTYPDDLDDKSFVGIEIGDKSAVIYHSRELEDEDIVHELLHIKFPEKSEDEIEKRTNEMVYGQPGQ